MTQAEEQLMSCANNLARILREFEQWLNNLFRDLPKLIEEIVVAMESLHRQFAVPDWEQIRLNDQLALERVMRLIWQDRC